MADDKTRPDTGLEVDLDEVKKLVDALERDLAEVRSGSRDLQTLRDEVETLKNVLQSPIRRHHWVREGLQGLREAFEDIGPLAGLHLSDVNLIHFQTHHRARGVGHADDRLIEGFEGVPGQGQGGAGAFRPRGRARWIPG